MVWYIVLFVAGAAVAVITPSNEVRATLDTVEPIAMIALVASLLMPFAGFSKEEAVHRWIIQYALTPIFGVYAVVVWQDASINGVLLFLGPTVTHFAYWLSGVQSRAYRRDIFFKTFAPDMPDVAKHVARLAGTGRSKEADDIIKAVLAEEK